MARWRRDRGAAVWRVLGELGRGVLDLALPPTCAGCRAALSGAAPGPLCISCDRRLHRIPAGLCLRCQQAPRAAAGALCTACEFTASPLVACVAAVHFTDEVESWIHRFKYPRAGLIGLDPAPRAVVRTLVQEAARLAPGPAPGLIAPIPLHPRRLRERGFNPAGLLARSLASELGVAHDPVALRRLRATASQTGLDRRARRRNVRGAFRARRGLRAPERVWLVDDVVTTGSTLEEAARAMRRAGARQVLGICAARTPRLT